MNISRRALLTGWASFFHGEATAGDLLALRTVSHWLRGAGWSVDTALSRGLTSDGVDLATVDPADYSLLVFACGPCHGWQVEELHERFAGLRRIAVGVSIVDDESPAVLGFHALLPRDSVDGGATVDLAAGCLRETPLVVGVSLANLQPEYGGRQRHHQVHEVLGNWLAGKPVAVTTVETRVARDDWRLGRSADQVARLLGRVDVVISSRMHGMVLALEQGVPVIALDPIHGGAKVTAQARAWQWPAVIAAETVSAAVLDHWWDWCQTPGSEVAVARSQLAAATAINVLRDAFTDLVA